MVAHECGSFSAFARVGIFAGWVMDRVEKVDGMDGGDVGDAGGLRGARPLTPNPSPPKGEGDNGGSLRSPVPPKGGTTNDPRRAEELRHLEQVKLNARVAEWEFKGAGWMEYLKEVAAKFGMTLEAAQLFFDNHYQEADIPKDPIERERALLYLRKNVETGKPPKWLLFSGLWGPTEQGLKVSERRQRLQNLFRMVKALMREAVNGKLFGLKDAEDERTIYWEPGPEVCRALEISQSKLTQLMKEYCGSNLPQMADEVRGERVMGRMRKEVRERIAGWKGRQGEGEKGRQGEEDRCLCAECAAKEEEEELGATFSRECWEIWAALKASRKAPEFSRDSWAEGYGFANYRRMYRACRVVYQMTPQQMEMALIEEALRKTRENEGKDGEWEVFYAAWKGLRKEFKEWNAEELDRATRGVKTWDQLEMEERERRTAGV